MDSSTILKLRSVNILDVAEALDMKLYGRNGNTRKALCFIHEDQTPSLSFNISKRCWKCFACGEGGGPVQLVMKHENLDYDAACQWIIKQLHIDVVEQNYRPMVQLQKPQTRHQTSSYVSLENKWDYLAPSLVSQYRSSDSIFCQSMIECNILTHEQIVHAAEVYRLGTWKGGEVIFWSIDNHQNVCEGKIMTYLHDGHRSHDTKPSTVSTKLKYTDHPVLPREWQAHRCLFGLHLLADANPKEVIVAIVESEKTAIICSERMPIISGGKERVIWLACGGLTMLSPDMFLPLKGHRIILFPDTDDKGAAFKLWSDIASDTQKKLGHPIFVSNILERLASDNQKLRKIDIADFIIESG